MKKIISILLMALILLFALSACEQILPSRSNEGYTEEELNIYKISDKAITDKFGTKNLSAFQVSIRTLADGRINVSYELKLYGIYTNEKYSVYLNPSLEVVDIHAYEVGVYSKHINDKEFEESLEDAKEKIKEQAQKYGEDIEDGMLHYTEIDGYICLCLEIIVDIDPPTYETDENETAGGCGIDHEHVFFSEQICKID